MTLAPGVQVALHFSDHRIVKRVVEDPVRHVQVERESLVMYVDEVNGGKVDKMYSILSQRHAAELGGYLENKRYLNYTFVITKDSAGTIPPRIVSVLPR